MIKLFAHHVYPESIQNVTEVLQSGWTGLGPKVAEFEQVTAKYLNTPHVIALNSGTAALQIALTCLNIPKGSYIITTPLTFIATNHCILQAGHFPVFADIEPDTGNIDPASIQRLLDDKFIGHRVKAIMVVHYGGMPVNLDAIYDISNKYNIDIIEDAAHAFGAEYQKDKIGCLNSKFVCFPSNTMIITNIGNKKIKDIKIGDRVLTKSGEYNRVLAVHKNKFKGQFLTIYLNKNTTHKLTCTPDHPIYICRNDQDIWMSAKDIIAGDWVYVTTHKCCKCNQLIPYFRNYCGTCNRLADLDMKRKAQLRRGGPKIYKAQIHKHFINDIQPYIKKFEQEGYRVIPTSPIIPDLILFKDNKIISVEIENKVTPRLSKLDKYKLIKKYYDDVMWVTKPSRIMPRRYNYEIKNGLAKVLVTKVITRSGKRYRDYNRSVYNLTVKNDPTYFASHILVHNCFSLHSVKPLAVGDGGLLTTNDPKIAETAKLLRWFGINKNTSDRTNKEGYTWDYKVVSMGGKYHMNDITAAIGLGQFLHYEGDQKHRQALVNKYRELLTHIPGIEMLTIFPDRISANYLMVIKLLNQECKNKMMKYLYDQQIQTGCHYRPSNLYPMYQKYTTDNGCRNAMDFFERCISLPLHVELNFSDIEFICNTIKQGIKL